MLEIPTAESTAMKVKEGAAMAVNQKKNNFPAGKKKQEEVWCTYCKKPRHTKEKC